MSHLAKRLSTTLLVSCSLCLSVASAQGQQMGGVSGTVSSTDGVRLPLTTITLSDPASGDQFRTASDLLGAFLLDGLPPATYDVVVDFPGFTQRSVEIVIGAGKRTALAITLEPAGVQEVVTVAGALPRESVEVTQIRESAARDVGEALSETAGLWKLRKGGIANDVVLRGLQSRDLNVLIDGARIYGACPNHMDPPAFHVDFSEVERIDVGKGPFDVRYQGSLGGVINIVTKRPETGWHAVPSLAVGAFGFVNPAATASYGGEQLSLLAGASYRRSDPYRDGNGALMTSQTNYLAAAQLSDAFSANTLWGRAAWRLTEARQVETTLTRQRTDHVLYPYLQMDAIYDNADRVAVRYEGSARGAFFSGLKAQGTWSQVDHWMTDQYRTSSTGTPRQYSMGTDATSLTYGGRAEAVVGRTTLGAEGYRRNWNTTTAMAGMAYAIQYSIPDVNIDSMGFFAEHTRAVGTKTSLDVGGRLDRLASTADANKANRGLYLAYHGTERTSRTDVLPSGRVKVTRAVSSDMELGASLGHTARVAEANERFFALRRMGTDWVGNPDLAPTRNTGLELSWTMHRPGVTLAASGFVNDVRNYVAVVSVLRQAMVPGVMNPAAPSFLGVDARLRGIEVNGSVNLLRHVSLSGDVSYVRGTRQGVVSRGVAAADLAETPPLRSQARVRFDDGRAFAVLEGVVSARQTRVDRVLGETETPFYALINLQGGVRHGGMAFSVGVANLLDRWFVEHLSYQRDPFRSNVRLAEPGRNGFANVSWRF